MVQKHDMAADFEKLNYDAAKLKEAWKEAQIVAKKLVDAKGTSYHILIFIDWINENAYSGLFFPGFSLGKLLISNRMKGS